MAGQFGKLAVNLLSMVVLARLIGAEDYGLIAMVVSLVGGVADLIRDMGGLSAAAVRSPSLSLQQRTNLWWINTFLGGACMVAVCALAPLIAWFYGEPKVTLLAMAMSMLFAFGGMTTQYSADLMRRLKFGRQAAASVSAAMVAFLAALGTAMLGWGGYWSLALQQILGALLTLVFFAIAAGWLPGGRFRRGAGTREFFRFGMPLFGTQILTYYSGNIDSILVGRMFGSASLGFYSRGIQVVRMPMNQIRSPLSNVALSTLSKVREDRERYAGFVATAQLAVLYPTAILSTGLAATSQDVIPIVLGGGWGAGRRLRDAVRARGTWSPRSRPQVAGCISRRGGRVVPFFDTPSSLPSCASPCSWEPRSSGSMPSQRCTRWPRCSSGPSRCGTANVRPAIRPGPPSSTPRSASSARRVRPSWSRTSAGSRLKTGGLLRFLVTGTVYVATFALFLLVPAIRRDLANVVATGRKILSR